MSSSSISLQALQTQTMHVYSRRLLLLRSPPIPDVPAPSPSDAGVHPTPANSFDANVVVILAILFCAMICALGLNWIVRCALRCSSRAGLEPAGSSPPRGMCPGERRRALRSLPTFVYSEDTKLPGSCRSECAICISDFEPGECVRVLPECKHGFHARCVDRWLLSRPSCPTCRTCLSGSGKKASGLAPSAILPLEPEGLIAR